MKVNLNKEVIEGLLLEQGCCYLLHDYRELLIEHLRAKKFVLKTKLVTQRVRVCKSNYTYSCATQRRFAGLFL
jgi:hypothetical protein